MYNRNALTNCILKIFSQTFVLCSYTSQISNLCYMDSKHKYMQHNNSHSKKLYGLEILQM